MAQYKFKSSTETYSVRFDGPHIPLLELRAKIVAEQNIVKGRDLFVLELSNAQTGEVYDEEALIPRNTAVLVKRVPQQRREAIVGAVGDDGSKGGANPTGDEQSVGGSAPADVIGVDGGKGGATMPAPGAAAAEAAARAAAAARAGFGTYGTKLIDPLSGCVFVDAVITTCCGTSFSKEPLARYVKQTGECPSCRVNWISNGTKVLPNRSLREAVQKAHEAAAEAGGGGGGDMQQPQQPRQPLQQLQQLQPLQQQQQLQPLQQLEQSQAPAGPYRIVIELDALLPDGTDVGEGLNVKVLQGGAAPAVLEAPSDQPAEGPPPLIHHASATRMQALARGKQSRQRSAVVEASGGMATPRQQLLETAASL